MSVHSLEEARAKRLERLWAAEREAHALVEEWLAYTAALEAEEVAR